MRSGSVRGQAMAENHPWQLRARSAGLSQRLLARILGHTEANVSAQLRGHWQSGVPQHVKAAIIVWEMLTPEQRQQWLVAVESERGAPDNAALNEESGTVSLKKYRILEKRLAKALERIKKPASPRGDKP